MCCEGSRLSWASRKRWPHCANRHDFERAASVMQRLLTALAWLEAPLRAQRLARAAPELLFGGAVHLRCVDHEAAGHCSAHESTKRTRCPCCSDKIWPRSQAARCDSIALNTVYRCMPSATGPPSRALVWIRAAASGQ